MKDLKTAQTSYADAGVNIGHGNQLVDRIKNLVKSTHRDGVMGGIGGFGGLFDLSGTGYKKPVLVSGTDGVGTKLKLAIETGRHDGIGIDLVAMCVNDLLVLGAEPLFFLDYYASGKLEVDTAETIISGIVKGCTISGCALIGGETAEMPGMYHGKDYDLAGFCVGIVEKDRIIDGSGIREGDAVIAVASSGAHSNGYSLIRKLLTDSATPLDFRLGDRPLVDILLEPTRIYVKPVLDLLSAVDVKGIAHITGGGLMENLPRVLPDNIALDIDTTSWQWPGLFDWLQSTGSITDTEMYTVFNCGIGLVLVVDKANVDAVISHLDSHGEQAWRLGEAVTRTGDTPPVILS